jgi:hypothetical protein
VLLLQKKEKLVEKGDAVLQAIRDCDVGSDVIIHNSDGSCWAILKLICKEEEH